MANNILEIFNPANGKKIREVACDSIQSIEDKFQKLGVGQKEWKKITVCERVKKIQKFSDLLLKNIEHLASVLTSEVGKPLQESRNEVNGAVKKISFFLKESERILKTSEVNIDGVTREILTYDPLGIIVNISAWNFPYLVGVNIFIPALISGNAVLYKPSEFSTLTGLEIEGLMYEAGIPKNVFTSVIGKGDVGEALLNLNIDGVYFTGSYPTGKKIAEKIKTKMIPMILELGGKDPLYVTDDLADVNQVAEAVSEGCFYNNGQSCCAVERVYVHEKVYDQFIEAFLNTSKNLSVGDPLNSKNTQGAITRSVHVNYLQEQVDQAIKSGAKLLLGGKKIDGEGAFFPPTILVNVNHHMSVMKDETFGPVRGVMKVKNDEEAINLMNDTEYGLTAAVYCQDQTRAESILERVNSGTSYINCCDRVSAYLPWSGRGHSGFGSSLSHLGIYAFTKPRGIHKR